MKIDYSNLEKGLLEKALLIFNSNMIEGIFVPIEDTLRLLEPGLAQDIGEGYPEEMKDRIYSGFPADRRGEDYNVLDHAKALDYALGYPTNIPLTHGFIWKMHSLLMKTDFEKRGIRLESYRDCQVYVGNHVPPNVAVVPIYMENLVQAIQSLDDATEKATEENIWTLHNEFLYIHPFIDGNGRSSRILLNALRKRHGFDLHIVEYEKIESYYRDIENYDSLRARKGLDFILKHPSP